jgi:hypothetical protein
MFNAIVIFELRVEDCRISQLGGAIDKRMSRWRDVRFFA